MQEKLEIHTALEMENLKERDCLQNLDINRKLTLKWSAKQ
jgi:hypothetical protein